MAEEVAYRLPHPQEMEDCPKDQDLTPDPKPQFCDYVCPNLLSGALGVLCLPLTLLGGITQINAKQHAAMLYYGKYVGSLQEPGLYCLNPCGLELRRVGTALNTLNMQSVKVLDAKGNPVVLKAVVTYYATSAKKATIDVENPFPSAVDNAPVLQASGDQPILKVMGGSFLELQAAAVLKQVASRFPYEAAPGLPSLQTEGAEIALELRHLLQERTGMTGACIVSFDLIDLSYAPEIAQAMLVRQQAEALVDARRLIVQAAVEMTSSAVENMKNTGANIDEQTQQQITTNLLTVICSGASATPTIQMNTM
mmetsp:Transcript_74474/g.125427  ORF Transcript_74474/g.125427 Transcript_74474/m.125427 type:complete len:310 (+) Transcript_74474:51-980(+)|eukprot:CAMPEP_0174288724 /NCGR_PEP_ID=MMETSP0809-20121228/21994_1 /TAXON_ID=73025 ORGANISM="Eutreptiella gymnastica-like, Strain CCMP1594" /NCGR_SAMPLE_ID=MMETSP0809 /ASSEMBLY_ACC=CAM_ASM_000658 /LENGTH=309 /DNA_ID=CAMNT_0015386145 /DNA_START=51 /DNA_END=980 /DNA_ORIENTATION=+